MNPECRRPLHRNGANIADRAHIVEVRDDGTSEFANLILLCVECHRIVDTRRKCAGDQRIRLMLAEWKRERSEFIRTQFKRRFDSFLHLQAAILPRLKRNCAIYRDYGPGRKSSDAERHQLWRSHEPELIRNNEAILLMLRANKKLVHPKNQQCIDDYEAHIREFHLTRDDNAVVRQNLFPSCLLSMFGIEQSLGDPPPSVSALQNLLALLLSQGRLVELCLVPDADEPYVRYLDNQGKEDTLHLTDTPRLWQVYWNDYLYRPQTTSLRTKDLLYVLKWLKRHQIEFRFEDVTKLTNLVITLSDKQYNTVLCYEYCVSYDFVRDLEIADDLLLVNLYNWNLGPISNEAREYAESVGIRYFNQKAFLRFVHDAKRSPR